MTFPILIVINMMNIVHFARICRQKVDNFLKDCLNYERKINAASSLGVQFFFDSVQLSVQLSNFWSRSLSVQGNVNGVQNGVHLNAVHSHSGNC